MEPPDQSTRGVICAFAAFSFWGMIPAFYKLLGHVTAPEIVAHRVIWTVVLSLIILVALRRFDRYTAIWRNPASLRRLVLSAALISGNWLVFLWAVTHDQVLETSMGYFINPLFSVLLGVVVLRERLRPGQAVAVGLAAIGVGYLILNHGTVPWVALVLPLTFGLYGLIRKQTNVDSLSGLATEMTLMFPVALAYAVWIGRQPGGHFGMGEGINNVYLMLNGPVTVFPLTMFAMAARRVRLSTIGFIQYLAPSLTFLLAVFVFREPFDRVKLITFACIWLSLLIYTLEGVRWSRMGSPRPEATTAVE